MLYIDYQVEAVQEIVDVLISSLVEAGDNQTLAQLVDAMNDDEGVDKREQTLNAGKK